MALSLSAHTKRQLALSGLILLYWFTRLHKIEALGFFLDEAAHADWARLVWRLQPFHAASDGKLLSVLWIAVFWPLNAGVWVARVSGVLVTIIGFACLLAFTRRAFSSHTARATGLLYILFPLPFFFERMAIPDSMSAAFVAGAMWTAGKAASRRDSTRWALLCGATLTAAVLTKLPNLIFTCLPLIAALILIPFHEWRRGLRLAGTIYLGCVVTLTPVVLALKYIGYSDLGFDLLAHKTGTGLAEVPGQVGAVGLSFAGEGAAYMPFPMWPFAVLGLLIALWPGKYRRYRSTWFVAGVLFITLSALIIGATPGHTESRYLATYTPLLASLIGAGLARLKAGWRPVWLMIGLILWVVAGWAFILRSWYATNTLPLPVNDRWQYISGWPSGYGFREIAEEMIARSKPVQLVTLDLGGEQRFEAYLLGRTSWVTAGRFKPGMSFDDNSLLIIDTPKDDQELSDLSLKLTEITRYPRPGGDSALVIYRVAP